jgi:hypothetical protein
MQQLVEDISKIAYRWVYVQFWNSLECFLECYKWPPIIFLCRHLWDHTPIISREFAFGFKDSGVEWLITQAAIRYVTSEKYTHKVWIMTSVYIFDNTDTSHLEKV